MHSAPIAEKNTETPTLSCSPLLNRNVPALEHISHSDDYHWLYAMQDVAHNSEGEAPGYDPYQS